MRSMIKACVFVDWHNVEANLRSDVAIRRPRYLQSTILRIQEETAQVLKRHDSTVRYRAVLRFYHGWHVEDRPTPSRLNFDRLVVSESFSRTIGIVSFAPEIKFGNELACDTPRNPLFSTSRSQGQKMIDTAIACDLLYMLRTGAAAVGIVMSDDDDFIPAIFTAEAWGLQSILLRTNGHTIDHISKTPSETLVNYWVSRWS